MNVFRNLKIRTKLLIGFGILTVILLIIGIKDNHVLNTYKNHKDEILRNLKIADNVVSEMKYLVRKEINLAMQIRLSDNTQ